MRTLQYCPLHLDGSDFFGNSRIDRNVRYVEWFRKYPLGDSLHFLDNGSSDESIAEFERKIGSHGDVFIKRMPLLTGNHFKLDYPYCWRALHYITNLIGYFDKIVLVDSDWFILSERMRDYIRRQENGWEAFWCDRHGFPEASVQILCRDSFGRFTDFWGAFGDWVRFNGKLMERELPFTKVNKDFKADRFGELRLPQQSWMDAYGQAPLDIPLRGDMGAMGGR